MRLNRIVLENFKCFEHKEINFFRDFTVLIGNNASGKTALLDAIAVALGGFLSGFDGVGSRSIFDDEVRLKSFPLGSVIDVQPQYSVRISGDATIANKQLKWTRTLNGKGGKTTRLEAKSIINFAKKVQKEVREGNSKTILPIISYYGTGRLWYQKKEKTKKTMAKINSRLLGYTDCLDPASNEKLMIKWFEKMTLIKFEQEKEPEELRVVRNVLKHCLKNVDENRWTKEDVDILYSFKSEELEITFGNKERLPFRMLSDGYRNTLGMIADIAYRMAVLNPQLLDRVAQETPGIVLIDEIDLHLHPKWQRKIIDDLKYLFPKVQFIVTTHSPFIIQSLDVGELRVLDIEEPGDYVDLSIEDIIENVMGLELPQWSERRRKMYEAAEKYFLVLNSMNNANDQEVKRLGQELERLSKPFADNVAYYAFLEQKKLLKELEMEGK